MTTLLVSEVFPPKHGGSGRWFWEIYRRLSRSDYAIATSEHPKQEAFDRSHDLRLERLPLALPSWGLLNSLPGYWKAIRAVRKLAVAQRVNELHCGRVLPEGLIGLALKWRDGIPYCCYIHGEEIQVASTSRELRWLVRWVMRGARLLIANSRNTRRILVDLWQVPEEKVELLYPGVDTERFVPAPHDSQVREALGWGNRDVVLTVGRLQKRKGHDQLIRALPEIRRHFPKVLYAIVGEGEERPHLESLARQIGVTDAAQFCGELSDDAMVRCYQQCDLFTLPNRQVGKDIEGFGMVLLEAQACGKVVVAGDSGGTIETMRVAETGQIVDCNNLEALSRVIMELLGDPVRRSRMGAAGRSWVVSRFDWKSLSQQAGAVFRGCPL